MRVDFIKKTAGSKYWGEGNPGALLVGMCVSTATMENIMGAPQRIELP